MVGLLRWRCDECAGVPPARGSRSDKIAGSAHDRSIVGGDIERYHRRRGRSLLTATKRPRTRRPSGGRAPLDDGSPRACAIDGRGDVKALAGRDGRRLGVADYRVIFDVDRLHDPGRYLCRDAGQRPPMRGSEMKPQTITTPGGEELVILPRMEYDALRAAAAGHEEDAADAAIYDARKADLARSFDARLPPEVSAAMMRGDSLLKALRKMARRDPAPPGVQDQHRPGLPQRHRVRPPQRDGRNAQGDRQGAQWPAVWLLG